MSWGNFPCEIRWMILTALTRNESSLSRYASVCREWQQVIEQSTFHQVKVTPERLPWLDEMTRPRRASLRCIKLSILLLRYDCSQCDRNASELWQETDTLIVKSALRYLLEVLSTWKSSSRGLTLDIAIFSPSDMEHYHRDCVLDDTQNLQHRQFPLSDTRHRWKNNRQVSLPPEPAINRLFQTMFLGEDFWDELPQVPVVTILQLRRQTRRTWIGFSGRQLVSLFPMLQSIYFEPWLDHLMGCHAPRRTYAPLFESLDSVRMTKAVIFEDFNILYDSKYMYSQVTEEQMATPRTRELKSKVGGALARASLGLESLSASFTVDARDFFGTCSATWIWENLTSLALTSMALAPQGYDCVEFNDILQAAANVATRMPKLDTMVLWNYKSKTAVGAFIYEASVAERRARVTWRATWNIPLRSSMIQSWAAIALERTSSELVVVKDFLHPDLTSQPLYETIIRLKLPCEVVHRESLQQMQQEVLYRATA